MIALTPHPVPRFAIAALVALHAGLASPVAAGTATLLRPDTGAEVQELRFCRPGERPQRPGQCLTRGWRPLI